MAECWSIAPAANCTRVADWDAKGGDLSAIVWAYGTGEEVCLVVKLFRLDYDGVLSYKTVLALMPWHFYFRFTATEDAGALHKMTVSSVP
jgi:hypothetical protein